MCQDFCHLHLHTDYSMLDGACQIGKLADMAAEMKMPALAITDHGNMHGAVEFYTALKKKDIKPVFGCEFYMAPDSRLDKSQTNPNFKGFHQIIYAKNMAGYQNLCRLNATAYMDGYYYNPRIDKEVLEQYSEGLVATSTCLGSEVNYYLAVEEDVNKAKACIDDFVQILGKENYFLELQDHGIPEQRKCNKHLIDFSKEFDIPLIATNDSHYLCKEHAKPHDALLCIGTGKVLADEKRLRFSGEEFYLKSQEEMAAIFKEVPESLTNTRLVADMCTVDLDFDTNHYPVFDPPDGSDREEYILELCKQALVERYDINLGSRSLNDLNEKEREVVERMEYELEVIRNMGFTSYFLVVWDFLHYARQIGIPVGPGRGSGAGSIVAYLLRITDVEPLSYGLLFERFLNPDRVSPPDFDIDLCERRRGEVIEFVRDKYGEDHVAQICTFGTLKAKAVIKDVARVMGRSFDEGNQLTKMVPDGPKVDLKKALEESNELRQAYENEHWVREIITNAEPLEGLNRNLSIHACGLIIGDQPLTNLIPLSKGAGDEQITQFPAGPCEMLGLLKMDFLGLKTLTIISDACEFVKKVHNIDLLPDEIPLDDAATYELITRGETVGVFQLESGGMQDLCRRWKLTRIEDVIALIALYRPGPMQFIDEFLDRKFGRIEINYEVECMRPILEETYGIMIYQEQVMQVAQEVAGFSLGQADILRRAMGKKKADEMASLLDKFVIGCKENGIDQKTAKALWDKIETFAGYGFNKSHSAAYAFLAVRTAYLKANHPVEFMCANLCQELGKADRIAQLTAECSDMGIQVLPPDINVSEETFTVDTNEDDPAIRFGLAAVKGVGDAAAKAILNARNTDGPFENLQDFCERVGSSVNRRLMESLTQCGAFDCFNHYRSQIFEIIDDVIQRAQANIRDRKNGQANFFDLMVEDDSDDNGIEIPIPDIPEWDMKEMLKYEKALLGFYVTGHPLDEYEDLVESYSVHRLVDIPNLANDTPIRMPGVISTVSRKISKRDGRPWAIINLEDRFGSCECLMFSNSYADWNAALFDDSVIYIEGHISQREGNDSKQIIVNKAVPIEDAPQHFAKELIIPIRENHASENEFAALKDILQKYPGETTVMLSLILDGGEYAFIETSNRYCVTVTRELQQDLKRFTNGDPLKVKANLNPPARERRAWERRQAPAQS